mmetsp:Transcript_33471/g.99750  ORF Transcript_33471/g.99750 Transcript_33471/m.99750 type:complete len:306 (-) Transcript_33471:554-1471(-)
MEGVAEREAVPVTGGELDDLGVAEGRRPVASVAAAADFGVGWIGNLAQPPEIPLELVVVRRLLGRRYAVPEGLLEVGVLPRDGLLLLVILLDTVVRPPVFAATFLLLRSVLGAAVDCAPTGVSGGRSSSTSAGVPLHLRLAPLPAALVADPASVAHNHLPAFVREILPGEPKGVERPLQQFRRRVGPYRARGDDDREQFRQGGEGGERHRTGQVGQGHPFLLLLRRRCAIGDRDAISRCEYCPRLRAASIRSQESQDQAPPFLFVATVLGVQPVPPPPHHLAVAGRQIARLGPSHHLVRTRRFVR